MEERQDPPAPYPSAVTLLQAGYYPCVFAMSNVLAIRIAVSQLYASGPGTACSTSLLICGQMQQVR